MAAAYSWFYKTLTKPLGTLAHTHSTVLRVGSAIGILVCMALVVATPASTPDAQAVDVAYRCARGQFCTIIYDFSRDAVYRNGGSIFYLTPGKTTAGQASEYRFNHNDAIFRFGPPAPTGQYHAWVGSLNAQLRVVTDLSAYTNKIPDWITATGFDPASYTYDTNLLDQATGTAPVSPDDDYPVTAPATQDDVSQTTGQWIFLFVDDVRAFPTATATETSTATPLGTGDIYTPTNTVTGTPPTATATSEGTSTPEQMTETPGTATNTVTPTSTRASTPPTATPISTYFACENQDGYLAWWRMDEGEGSTIDDSVCNNFTLTMSDPGHFIWTDGVVNGALKTAASKNPNSGLYPDKTIPHLKDTFSIVAWVHPSSGEFTQSYNIVSRGAEDGSAWYEYKFSMDQVTQTLSFGGYTYPFDTGSIVQGLGNIGAVGASSMPENSFVITTPFKSIALETWQHVAMVYDHGEVTLFINGEEKKKAIFEYHIPELGYDLYSMTGGFSGSLDELSYYTIALTPEKVSQLYESERPGIEGAMMQGL